MNRFRQLYIENVDKLYAYLLRKSGNVHLTADLVQESFARCLERYGSSGSNSALLFTVGRNLFYDHVRKANSFIKSKEAFRAELTKSDEAGQEDKYIAEEQHRNLLAAIEQLSDDEQDILALVLNGNLKYSNIAKIRGCSESLVKVTVHRARKKIRLILKDTEHE
ncbi:MAG: RNA polymerase sigma factor [Desulfopila sp.]|jgi:RNA polymerase sigma-70 factor (ECF subfamily)|nr:RNA polymerase sigma factor [Desulfopila sp.]